jgi:hypothetical protein
MRVAPPTQRLARPRARNLPLKAGVAELMGIYLEAEATVPMNDEFVLWACGVLGWRWAGPSCIIPGADAA